MDDAILILEWTLHHKKLAAYDRHAVTFIEVGRHDHICNACLILH